MSLALGTWRALLAPRRALPLGLLLVALLSAEWAVTRSFEALLVDLALFVGFCLVAPTSYRLVVRPVGPARGFDLYRLALYGLFCAAAVFAAARLLPAALGLPATYIADPSGMGILCVLFWVGGWGLARDIEFEHGYETERNRAERLAQDAERASLLALRAQLDPHFLFNTLNAIAEWCREDPAVAEAATLRLASLLRAMLEGIKSPSWPLTRELSLAEGLFELYRIRDRERYRFRIEAPSPLPELFVPPMILLPLLENAITHGPSAGHAGQVVLRLEVEGPASLRVEIENPGDFGGRRAGGEGIAMVERRLALAYGREAQLTIVGDGARTSSVVVLPIAAALGAV